MTNIGFTSSVYSLPAIFMQPSKYLCIFLLTLTAVPLSRAWHDFTNVDFHCWPLSASETKPTAFAKCTGISIRWVLPPPDEVKAETYFNVTYELLAEDSFYDWAVSFPNSLDADYGLKGNIFGNAGPSQTGFTNASAAKEWCVNTTCPASYSQATIENCCIYHVNVHSCPLAQSQYCGPWIKASGSTYTHSDILIGSPSRGNWTSLVRGLYEVGVTQIIAHFKFAGMHIALYKNVKVVPRTVCGDGQCETNDGETCSNCPADCGGCPLGAGALAGIGIAAVIVLGLVIAVVVVLVCFRIKAQKLLWDESWIIAHDDIKPDNAVRGFMGSMVSMQTSLKSLAGVNALHQQAATKQVFTKTALHEGRAVAVRDIQKKDFALSKQIRAEVRQVRELDHPNICKFIGGCIEVPNVCILSEYCPKGSLSDVLLNEDVPLNWGFRFSFLSDISRGLHYLHSKKIFHGKIKSNNCVVDDRWTVKVTDFGLQNFRKEDKDGDDDDAYYKELNSRVYQAPEIIDVTEDVQPTAAADVYAYSIIMVEVATRNDPLGDSDAQDVTAKWRPEVPDFSAEANTENACPCPDQYVQLMKQCWAEKAADRPSFETVKRTVAKINPSKQSPVDLMMAMMEKYSKHLEAIVSDRTADLIQEKQKTDRLLYSMLPRAVADDLRQGKTINAVWYDSCTIYFSDIVGFTDLAGGSTPMEVVALLNKLYVCFDSIIDEYDVYKVETIGDAYMVVSGVPRENGIRHAYEIASMALDLVRGCETFVIPHKPNTPLKIRVGLHSGPVCAGVVGLKMPRYCLFGDTVNTASRMESNGEAYKVHLSNTTYTLLDKIGGFKLTCRGTIPIKGKGDMKTWWLLSKEKSLSPEPPRASPLPGQVNQPGELMPHDKADINRKTSTSNDSGYNEKHDLDLPDVPEDTTNECTPVDLPGMAV